MQRECNALDLWRAKFDVPEEEEEEEAKRRGGDNYIFT